MYGMQQVAGIIMTDTGQLEQLFSTVHGEQRFGGGGAKGYFFLVEQAAQAKTHQVSPHCFVGTDLFQHFEFYLLL
jgi:hypothetical protein